MDTPNDPGHGSVPVADVWGLWVERDGTGWAVMRNNDGRRTVISRHPTVDAGRAAVDEMNRTGPET